MTSRIGTWVRASLAAALAVATACGAAVELPTRACLDQLSACGNTCVDLLTSAENCGVCGQTCGAQQTCTSGRCMARCDAGLSACGTAGAEACVDTTSDPANCGGCGQVCGAGESCTFGVCHVGCAGGGWMTCGGACVDTGVDAANCGACGRACAAGETCWSSACVAADAAPPIRLYVSLTADDTFEHQFTAMAPILEANGVRGTFYVNAGRIDLVGHNYLTAGELQELQRVGHEIGSHGLTHQHLDLATNPPDRIRRELCDSRADLLQRGFAIRSFAYPFGSNDAFAEQTASDCGYVTARDVGTLSPSHGIVADAIPPVDAFALRAESSVQPTTTLDQVKGYVLRAETAAAATQQPGWLIINFHELCANALCSDLAWDTQLYSQFVSWLAARRAQGTVVRTISQVAGGPLGPPVRSAERFGVPLVINGDFESALAGDAEPPDCWYRPQSGAHSAAWTRVAGRSGLAQQLVVTDFTGGTSALVQYRGTSAGPDYRSCGTPVTPGHTYTFRCWYRSDVRVAFTLFKNDATHSTTAWLLSPTSPPSPDTWALKTFSATIPDGFSTVFFGPQISSVCTAGCLNGDSTATLVVDDCSAVDEG